MVNMRPVKFRVLIAATTLLVTGLGVTTSAQTTPATQAPAKPKSTTTTKPAAAATYDRALLRPALLKDKAPETFQVKFETTRGDFTVTVNREWAPLAADRFYNLVKHHYFDNARFFRVVPNFVVQFGISAYPPVTAAWQHATIKDEPVTQKNLRGTLTFAKTSEPNSRTTEIFINLKDNPSLDSQGFAPFGAVDGNGMSAVDTFYQQYGDSAGMDQEPMEKQGEKYIAQKWPLLDAIKHASLVGAASAKPAAKPAAKPVTAKPAAASPSKPTAKPQ
jgi:peptidyl-prolyl cis-trans isomerase A (cyclophilin A)